MNRVNDGDLTGAGSDDSRDLTFFLFIIGSTSSPRSLGLLKKPKVEKAVKSNKSATQAVQNVS
jgi:hypothetical protein